MIYDNSTGDTFTRFYIDDPLEFLDKAKIDTEQARDRCLELLATVDTIMDELNRIERSEGKTDLWSRYARGELPSTHDTGDRVKDAFLDGLKIQADRIIDNLKKHFTNMTEEEIKNIIFSDNQE